MNSNPISILAAPAHYAILEFTQTHLLALQVEDRMRLAGLWS